MGSQSQKGLSHWVRTHTHTHHVTCYNSMGSQSQKGLSRWARTHTHTHTTWPVSVSDALCCFKLDRKILILLVKLAASLHLTALPPGSPPFSGRGGVVPSSDRVPGHPQVAHSGFSRARGVCVLAGRLVGGRKEEVPASRKHQGRSRDFPETPAGSRESERVSDPLPPSVSEPQQSSGNRSPPASRSWRRSPLGPGGRRAGRGGESGGGGGAPGTGLRGSGGLQCPGLREAVYSSQVRALRAGGAASGLRHSGRGRVGGDVCGERRVPPAQRLTLMEPGRIFSTPRGREPELAAPGEDPRPLRATEGQVRVPA